MMNCSIVSFLLFSLSFGTTDAFATIGSRNDVLSKSITNNGERSASSLSMGLTLYGSQGSRSPLVNWGAYESGVPIVMGDLSKNPHPFRQIPSLTDDDDVLVFESGAILQYLYSKVSSQDSVSRQAAITSWISWANASLDPICFLETPEGKV